jgi:Lrp/AsnC family transcriptional regulator for asnA, asnC and gidA
MDEKDRLILSLMQNNGRISFSEIGKVVGLTAMGAKKRVEKLLKDKVKIKALLNTNKLQLAMIAMEVENSDYLRKI